MRNRRGSGATTFVPEPDGTRDSLDITDLGERSIADRLDVPPAAIPRSGGRRRPPPVLIVIGAVALLAMAIGGPDVPKGVAPSGDPGAIASGEPTADPCPAEGLPDPKVTLGRRGWPSMTRDATPDRWANPASAGFRAPIDGFADVGAGDYMVLRADPAGCIADLRVDVQATGLAGGDGLGVTTRPTGDGRGWGLFGPPVGDWTVRVAMQLRGGTAGDGAWAIYFLRLRVDGAAWVEPVPDGEGPGSGDALVTPARPCQDPDPGADSTPELILTIGETAISSADAAFAWSGGPSATPDLSTLEVVAVAIGPEPIITIAGDRCAVNWRLVAGPMPAMGQEFLPQLELQEMHENPTGDPAVAAQNEFRLDYVPLGEFILMADLEFERDWRARVYWRLEIIGPEIPRGSVRARSGGVATAMVTGCGVELQTGGAVGGIDLYDSIWLTATTPCWGIAAESWPVVPKEASVRVASGDLLHVEVPGHPIRDWTLNYDQRIGEPGSIQSLGSGWLGIAADAIDIPAPPPGEWVVRIWLQTESQTGRMGIPYYFLLDVAG